MHEHLIAAALFVLAGAAHAAVGSDLVADGGFESVSQPNVSFSTR